MSLFDKLKPNENIDSPQPTNVEQQQTELLDKEHQVDDNGKLYRTPDGGWIPNNIYELDGKKYQTDDLGNIYKEDGKYYKDDFFVINGILYITDADGKLIFDDIPSSEMKPTDVEETSISENIDSRFKDLPHPNIPDRDWPPKTHQRVADEMFGNIDAIKRTNGNQDVFVDSKVLERNENGDATLWACSFESDDSRYVYIMGEGEQDNPDKLSLWGIAENCTNDRNDLEDIYYNGWDQILGVEYCVSRDTGKPEYVVVYTYNEAENHDMGRTFAPQYGSKIDVSKIDGIVNSFGSSDYAELCDDNGKQFRTEDGGWVPNNTYVLDEVTYKTDDNGNIYSIDGKLQPNATYELNGNVYTTDENGRIISCEAKPERSPENPRDNEAQRQAGGEDRRPNDQGGHIVGRDMNGDGGIGNLVAMDSKINQSDYKRMENDIKAALDEGKEVTTKTEMTYSGDSERPDKITVTVTADGKDTVFEFDNNLDGSLDSDVSEKSPSAKAILEEHPDAHVSSVKREYDENGNLVKTTAYITWTDEDGNNRRSPIIVPND